VRLHFSGIMLGGQVVVGICLFGTIDSAPLLVCTQAVIDEETSTTVLLMSRQRRW
jgi:hypothetical protein